MILAHTGLQGLSSIMNGVILLALLSACNSDLYSATRVLSHLAEQGSAPRVLAKNMHGVPVVALMLTAAFGLLSLLCDRLGSEAVFLWLVNVSYGWFYGVVWYRSESLSVPSCFCCKWADAIRLPYRAKFYPWGPLLALAVCGFVVGQGLLLLHRMHVSWVTWLSTYIGFPVVLILWLGHADSATRRRHMTAAA